MNWKQIPEIIQFCNHLNCSVYVSYLYKPERLSLWTLSSAEIGEIIDFLSVFEFPSSNQNEIYNLKCFNDIIKHLKYWQEENKKRKNIENETDYISSFINNLTLHLDKKKSRDPFSEAVSVSEQIKQTIIDTGYEEYIQKIFKELNSVNMDDILRGINSIPKDEIEKRLNFWFNGNPILKNN